MRLVIKNDILEDHLHELAPGITLVGRSSECALQILDTGVSRFHTRLEVSNGRVLVEDLGSANGTFVNGERIEGAAEIEDGDTVRFGVVDALFECPSVAPALPVVPLTVEFAVQAGAPPSANSPRVLVKILAVAIVGLVAFGAWKIFETRSAESPPPLASERDAAPEVSEAPPETTPETDFERPAAKIPKPQETEETPRTETPPPPERQADELVLADGTVFSGRLMDEDGAGFLFMEAEKKRAVRIPKEAVRRKNGGAYAPDMIAIFHAKLATAADTSALTALATWCETHDLPDQRRQVNALLVKRDPTNVAASELLGRYRYRGEIRTREELQAIGALGPDGTLEGTDDDVRALARLFHVALGRPPTPAERREALRQTEESMVKDLLKKPEFWTAWLRETGRALAPKAPAQALGKRVAGLGQRVADQELQFFDAFAELIASDEVGRILPYPEERVERTFQAMLGMGRDRDPLLFSEATKMWNGERVAVFGERGSGKETLVKILLRQPDFYRVLLDRLSRRLHGTVPDEDEVALQSFGLGANPDHLDTLLFQWLASALPKSGAFTRRIKDDRALAGGIYVTLLNIAPTEQWVDDAVDLMEQFGDRKLARAILIQALVSALPPTSPAENQAPAWIRRQYRQLLGRLPTPSEMQAAQRLITSDPLGAGKVLAVLLEHPEFAVY